jgi:hypothetical protein
LTAINQPPGLTFWDVSELVRGYASVREAGLTLTTMVARSEFPISEILLQPCHVNALRLDAARKRAVARVCRLSAPHHAASLISASFRDPFPHPGAPAIRDAIQLCLHVFCRNRPAFRRNPHLSDRFVPAMIPGKFARLSAPYLFGKSVTGCISMKTIIKPRIPFFPSCIMDLGTLTSPEYAACG